MGAARPVVLEGTTPPRHPSLEPRSKGAAAPPPRAPLPYSLSPPERPGRGENFSTFSGRIARLEPARQRGHTATHLPANTPEDARQATSTDLPRPAARADRLRHRPAPPLANSFLGPRVVPLPRGCEQSASVDAILSSASAQAPCPSHGGWPYRGWGRGEVKRSLFSFTKMASCSCFATVPTL